MPVRPAITRMSRRAASSKNSSVDTGLLVVNARQVVVPPASRASKKYRAAVRRVVAVLVFLFFGEDPGLQPIQQLGAVGPEDAHLRKVDVPVDEPRENQPVLQVGDRKVGVSRRDVGECAKILDNSILDDEQPIADEAGSVLLVSDVLPRVVDEVEERSSDRAASTGHDDSSSEKMVTL